jgi:hypothetical protein
LVLVEDLEVGAPAEQFFGGHRGPNFAQAHAQLFGDAELQQQPVVLAEFGA